MTHSEDDRIEYDEVTAQLRDELEPEALSALRSAGHDAPLSEVLDRIGNRAPRHSRADG